MSNYQAHSPALAEPVRRALSHANVIDITTTGRQSGAPRRIEIVYHVFDGRIYISGQPRADRRRSWIANLEADPNMTFHLKRGIVADLPATARIVTDPSERRAVMRRIIDTAWHGLDLETMVAHSPLIEVTIEGMAA
ncbi:MAG TPA: nitroreductase/quinone reductase family protein [Candidatus Limnocylindria bacterium]|nr:nitroreductase/quinone reductase family protein [Candidatus Limnocylindria bacterium]